MNTAKLNELSAQAMGIDPSMDYLTAINTGGVTRKWNPCEDLNDAYTLLMKAANGREWSIYDFPDNKKRFDVEIDGTGFCFNDASLCMAIVRASLFASGIPESSVKEALRA